MKASVVLFTYIKHENVKQILQAINAYNPAALYIIKDKSDNRTAIDKLLDEFTFNTKPIYIIPEKHQGILHIFDYALDIIFKTEEQLIILEDDTIPSPAFFGFCNKMLDKYKGDTSIGCINGANLLAANSPNSYFTSRVSLPLWGWATWRDRWISQPKTWNFWNDIINEKEEDSLQMLYEIFNYVKQYPKSWDTRWAMYLLHEKKQTILSGINLITNKGYIDKATFSNIPDSEFSNQPHYPFEYTDALFENKENHETAYIKRCLVCIREFRKRIIN